MEKPRLFVVTGRPGAGKSTFAAAFGQSCYLPVISRDTVKEGMVHTYGVRHDQLPADANLQATLTFFDTLDFLLDRKISVIAEAAFQHKLWSEFLPRFEEKAEIILLICRVSGEIALERFLQRGLDDPLREYFHGDKGVHMARQGLAVPVGSYEEPHLSYPTYYIDTADGYHPSIPQLWDELQR